MDSEKIGTCIPYNEFIAHFLQPGSHKKVEPVAGHQILDGPSAITHQAVHDLNMFQSGGGDCGGVEKYVRPPPSYNMFKDMPRVHSMQDMCQNVSNALMKTFLAQRGDHFVSATHYSNDTVGQSYGPAGTDAAFCGVYPSSVVSVDQQAQRQLGLGLNLGHVDWSRIEMAILCEPNSQADSDPWNESVCEDPNHARIVAAQRARALEQILDYARLIFQYQQRTYQFMVLFCGDMARIIRIDRSWIFTTHRCNYRDEAAGLKLTHFFWDYALLSASERGHDTTATRLDRSGPDAEVMRKQVKDLDPDDHVRAMLADTLDEQWPWWKLEVPDMERGESRSFLVGKPHFAASGVAGQATRGYIALDVSNPDGPPVYLKDAWRVVSDDIEQEGSVLKTLHKHNVQFIPTPVCHGDLVGQQTQTQVVWPAYHPEQEGPLKTHQHYRLVVKEVGKPLERFEHSFQLVGALRCCVLAHAQAYEDANIIHRDISTGNMLLFKNEEGTWIGLLNDWELSKRRDQQDKKERQPDRTGTWQFMSALALNDHKKSIRIEDELESFLHVILHISVRFLPHNLADAHVPQFLHDYFDDYSSAGTDHHCGTAKFAAMQLGFVGISQYNNESDGPDQLRFFCPTDHASDDPPESADTVKASTHSAIAHPLNDIVEPLLSWLSAHYILRRLERESRASLTTLVDGDVSQVLDSGFMCLMAKARRPHKAQDREVSSAAEAPRKVSTSSVAPDRTVLAERAWKLGSHTATLELFESVLSKGRWPPLPDRVAERKPAKGWIPRMNDQVPKVSFISGSRKRSNLESVSEDLPSPSFKKSKT
ncbi:hypothetical protein C8Q79DRAFT_1119960 [Trametes meyenii]|nr:hypothetical protein C8Q79DRAFT_1119960 [Trametes meyenii]